MRHNISLAVAAAAAIVAMLCLGSAVSANVQTFTFTSAGNSGTGGPVSGVATFTTSNGQIKIEITDLQGNIVSIGQSISDQWRRFVCQPCVVCRESV
jgi:ABC-type glycerol-3-phosphate transport system substrate-binding protein